MALNPGRLLLSPVAILNHCDTPCEKALLPFSDDVDNTMLNLLDFADDVDNTMLPPTESSKSFVQPM